MSFQFSDEDSLTKRQRQQVFAHTLDEQRRVNQELRQQQQQKHDRGWSHNANAVKPLHSTVPGSADIDNGSNRVIPGLEIGSSTKEAVDTYSSGGSSAKLPYMSALSEMNGRPLHVRQKQFEKESQYRNMLRDQIEENKRRKEAEKAKLEEEKRKELEEIRRLHGPTPRRQQHPQFQESPDHPLPSPGRLPPASYQQQLQKQSAEREMAPAYGIAYVDQYSSRNPPPPPRGGDKDVGSHRLYREERDHIEARNHRGEGGFPGRDLQGYATQDPQQHSRAMHYSITADLSQEEYSRDRGVPYPEDKLINMTPIRGGDGTHGHRARDGYRDEGIVLSGGQRSPAQRHLDDRGQEATAHSLMPHGAGSGRPEVPEGTGSTRTVRDTVDLVPRSDFEELTNLCRELLLEQKELRRKLEEREERGRPADHSNQQQKIRATSKPRRGSIGSQKPAGLGSSSARGDGVGRRTSAAAALPGQAANSRMQGERQWGNVARRDPRVKPGVAFGSSVPRMEVRSKVERPRLGVSSSQAARHGGSGDRDLRTSKSEPLHRHRNTSNWENSGGGTASRRHRTTVSSDGAVTGSGLFDNKRGSEPAWAREPGRNRTRACHVADSGGGPRDGESYRPSPPGVELTSRPMGRWATTHEDNPPRGDRNAHHHGLAVEGACHGTTAAGGTIHGLLGKNGPRISSSLAADSGDLPAARGDSGRNSSSRGAGVSEGYGELGGESTFLAPLPEDPGLGMGDRSFGRDGEGAFWDPRKAADPWAARR